MCDFYSKKMPYVEQVELLKELDAHHKAKGN